MIRYFAMVLDQVWRLPVFWVSTLVTVLLFAPLLWIGTWGPGRLKRAATFLAWVVGASVLLAPAMIQSASAGPTDNHGLLPGLLTGVLLAWPAVIAATIVAASVRLVSRLRSARGTAGSSWVASRYAGIVTFVPLAGFLLWLGVGLFQTG